MSLTDLRGKLLTSLLIGVGVVLIMGLLSDIEQVGEDMRGFDWRMLPAILVLTMLNYLLRWLKWHYYLQRLGLNGGVGRLDSGLIFTSGMVMSVTPGKVGEVFKSYLLRRVNRTPVRTSAPIVLAERLTDGLGMLLLMGVGLTIYPAARPMFVVLLGLSLVMIVIVQHRMLCTRAMEVLEPMPGGTMVVPRLRGLYETTNILLGWRLLFVSTALSVVSWGSECVAFYAVLLGLGVDGSWLLLLQATFIFAASTLLGLISFLPGGLGTSEMTSVGLLILLVGVTSSTATTATIIIRFCTLWFGVMLGALALVWFSQRYRADDHLDNADAPEDPPIQNA